MTTPAASRVLTELMRLTAEHGQAPSYKDLAKALGYTSYGPLSRHLGRLRRDGLITTGIIPTAWSQLHRCCPHCGGDLRKDQNP